MIKWSIILISISAFAKGVTDAIRFKPAVFIFQSDWWLERGEYSWNNRTFLEKYLFSFISGGWHLFDAVRISSLLLLAALLYVNAKSKIDNNKWLAVILFVLVAYSYHGLIFEIAYKLSGVK